jgi:hypothetical protein
MPASAAYAIMGANSMINANTQANAMEAQGEYAKKVGEMNARSLSIQADDAEKRGANAARRREVQTQKMQASQKVALAAAGATGSEVEQNVLNETAAIGLADADAIRVNAYRDAWGMRSQASNSILQGETSNLAAQNTARATMTTGYAEAAGYGLKAYGAEKERKSPPKRRANQSQGGDYTGDE